jgi:hypothetical protein
MGANPNLECSAAALESCAPQALSGKTERTAKLRETFVIPNNPQNLADKRYDWEGEVPVWVKLAVGLGLNLD